MNEERLGIRELVSVLVGPEAADGLRGLAVGTFWWGVWVALVVVTYKVWRQRSLAFRHLIALAVDGVYRAPGRLPRRSSMWLCLSAMLELNTPRNNHPSEFPYALQLEREKIDKLRKSCRRLGVALPPCGRVSRALIMRGAVNGRFASCASLSLLPAMVWASKLPRIIWNAESYLQQRAQEMGAHYSLQDAARWATDQSDEDILDLLTGWIIPGIPLGILGALLLIALLWWPFAVFWSSWRGGHVAGFTIPSVAVHHRSELPRRVTEAVNACARGHVAKDFERADAIRAVSVKLEKVEREVLRAIRTSCALRSRSPLKKATRKHLHKVARRVRAAEAAVIAGEPNALPELARLLLTVAERHIMGRVLELLDEEDLQNPRVAVVAPVRDWDLLRAVAFMVLCVCGALGVSRLDLSGIAETVALGGVAVAAGVTSYGKQWLSMVERIPLGFSR
ncbi:hypothetical protein [Streptomyces sp. NPDC059008]|uniref:hypothetical protein n=1 Tax=unclassified Streptomyces TaxID=2593676 RepID=UPI0036B1165E